MVILNEVKSEAKSYDILMQYSFVNPNFERMLKHSESFANSRTVDGYFKAIEVLNDALGDLNAAPYIVTALKEHIGDIKASYAKSNAREAIRLYDDGNQELAVQTAKEALKYAGNPPSFFVDDGTLVSKIEKILLDNI